MLARSLVVLAAVPPLPTLLPPAVASAAPDAVFHTRPVFGVCRLWRSTPLFDCPTRAQAYTCIGCRWQPTACRPRAAPFQPPSGCIFHFRMPSASSPVLLYSYSLMHPHSPFSKALKPCGRPSPRVTHADSVEILPPDFRGCTIEGLVLHLRLQGAALHSTFCLAPGRPLLCAATAHPSLVPTPLVGRPLGCLGHRAIRLLGTVATIMPTPWQAFGRADGCANCNKHPHCTNKGSACVWGPWDSAHGHLVVHISLQLWRGKPLTWVLLPFGWEALPLDH